MTDTNWYVSGDGDLICEYRGQKTHRSIYVNSTELPLNGAQIASLMNAAYQMGIVDAKADIRAVLGIKGV